MNNETETGRKGAAKFLYIWIGIMIGAFFGCIGGVVGVYKYRVIPAEETAEIRLDRGREVAEELRKIAAQLESGKVTPAAHAKALKSQAQTLENEEEAQAPRQDSFMK